MLKVWNEYCALGIGSKDIMLDANDKDNVIFENDRGFLL